MINTITITNRKNEKLLLELRNPEDSGFFISDIKGLGPVKSEINTTSMASNDGAHYNSSKVGTRNIVISLGFLPDRDIEKLRLETYKYFPVKEKINLRIVTDNRNVSIDGYVESNEPDIFSSFETTQVSIICPDPYFYDMSSNGQPSLIRFSGVEPEFEFEFGSDSTKELSVGSIITVIQKNINYQGNVPIGVVITLHAYDEVEGISIYNVDTYEYMQFDDSKIASILGSGITEGDEIIINTRYGENSVNLLRDGVYHNILNAVNRDASWFQLYYGNNQFAYDATLNPDKLQMQMEYFTLYEGI